MTALPHDSVVAQRQELPATMVFNAKGLQVMAYAGTYFFLRPDTHDAEIFAQELVQDRFGIKAWRAPRPEAVIVDVGGHIGLFARMAAVLNPKCQVFTFEANARNHGFMLANLGKLTNVRPYLGAVVDGLPARPVLQQPAHAGDHTGAWGFDLGAHGPVRDEEPVAQFFRLPEFMAQERLQTVDLLKLDCMGSEYAVLDSLSDAMLAQFATVMGTWHVHGPAWVPAYHRLRLRLQNAFPTVRGLPVGLPDAMPHSGQFLATRLDPP